MMDGLVEFIPATGIAEPDDMAFILCERIGLDRLAGPGTGLIDAIGNVERLHCAFLCLGIIFGHYSSIWNYDG